MGTNRDAFVFGAGTFLAITPLGAWGYLIAGMLGSNLYPPEYEKPDPYTQLGLNSAQTGIPIPLLYGTMRVGGNYVWKDRLERDAYHVDTGGKGGGKREVAGYRYYMNAAIGLCEGEIEVSRMWKNNDMMKLEGDNTITPYGGSSEQSVDPLISSKVNNPVPFRDLGYVVFDSFALGKDNAQAPNFLAECHNYPYESTIDPWARVLNYWSDSKAISSNSGIPMIRKNGNIVVFYQHADNSTSLAEYSPTLTLIRTHTIANLTIATAFSETNAIIVEKKRVRKIYVSYKVGNSNIDVAEITFNSNGAVITESRTILTGVQLSSLTMGGDNSHLYIGYRGAFGAGNFIEKIKMSDLTTVSNTDIKGVVGNSAIDDIDVNDDYVFVIVSSNLYNFTKAIVNVSGGVNISWDSSLCTDIHCPYGSRQVIGAGYDAVKKGFFRIAYYDANGVLSAASAATDRAEILADQFWSDGVHAATGSPRLHAGADGTLVVNWGASDTDLQHIIMDANPAQLLYDVLVNVRDIDPGKLNITSLTDFSAYCHDNNIGLSPAIKAKMTLRAFLRNILTYVQGAIYIDNDGKIYFKVFRNTDVPVATITEDDIVGEDNNLVNITAKDPRTVANRILINYTNRVMKYRKGSFQADNFLAQEEVGEIVTKSLDLWWISNEAMVSKQGYRLMKWEYFDTKVLQFNLMPNHLDTQIGDVLTLHIPNESISAQNVRVLNIAEPTMDKGGTLPVVARLEESYLNTFEDYDVTQTESEDLGVDEATAVRPVVWEQYAKKNDDTYNICLTAIRYDESTDACDIYYSWDDENYTFLKTLNNLAYTGDVETNFEDKDKQIEVDTGNYPDALSGVTVEEQRNDRSYCLAGEITSDNLNLNNFELMSFREIETAGDINTLKNCYRGKYYTLPKDHTTDEVIMFVSIDRFTRIPFVQADIGKTVFVKAVAINEHGDPLSFDDAVVYDYTIQGYTKKGTHTSGFQIEEGGEGQGSKRTTQNNDVITIWKDTNRNSGISAKAIDAWFWNDYVAGDVNDYDILVYDSALNLVATHESIGDVNTYTYLQATNTADFGGFTKHFWLGLRPKNNDGSVSDIDKIEIIINT